MRLLVAALAVVVLADVAVVATRSDAPAPRTAPVGGMAQPSAMPTTAAPTPKPPEPPKPAPPQRLVFDVTLVRYRTNVVSPPRVMSVRPNGTAPRAEPRLPPAPRHASSKALRAYVADEVLLPLPWCGGECRPPWIVKMGITMRRWDGGGKRFLTTGGYDRDPAISPDGTRIAYVSHEVRTVAGYTVDLDVIKVMRPDGRLVRKFVAPGDHSYAAPRWSPDGRHLAVVERAPMSDDGTIVLLSARGGRVRRLGRGAFQQLAWAPDGTFLVARGTVFVKHMSGERSATGWDLWIVPASGAGPRRLTFLSPARYEYTWGEFCGEELHERGARDPVVSADSRRVAFATNVAHWRGHGGRSWDVRTVGIDGKGATTVYRSAPPRCVAGKVQSTVARPLEWV